MRANVIFSLESFAIERQEEKNGSADEILDIVKFLLNPSNLIMSRKSPL